MHAVLKSVDRHCAVLEKTEKQGGSAPPGGPAIESAAKAAVAQLHKKRPRLGINEITPEMERDRANHAGYFVPCPSPRAGMAEFPISKKGEGEEKKEEEKEKEEEKKEEEKEKEEEGGQEQPVKEEPEREGGPEEKGQEQGQAHEHKQGQEQEPEQKTEHEKQVDDDDDEIEVLEVRTAAEASAILAATSILAATAPNATSQHQHLQSPPAPP